MICNFRAYPLFLKDNEVFIFENKILFNKKGLKDILPIQPKVSTSIFNIAVLHQCFVLTSHVYQFNMLKKIVFLCILFLLKEHI